MAGIDEPHLEKLVDIYRKPTATTIKVKEFKLREGIRQCDACIEKSFSLPFLKFYFDTLKSIQAE